MLRRTLLALALLCSLASFGAAAELESGPPGTTRWVEGQAGPGEPWSGRVTGLPGGSWALLEVEAEGSTADVDLVVEGSAGRRVAASHLGLEQLLQAGDGGPLEVQVTVPWSAEAGPVRFRLGLTRLDEAPSLEDWQGGALDAGGVRARLYTLGPGEGRRRVELRRVAGAGALDLFAFDARLEAVDLGISPGSDERCRVELDPAAPVRVLVLATAGQAGFEVEASGAGEQVPAGPLERYLERLGSTPEQRQALDALARHPDWLRLRSYLERYPGGQPLELRVVPGLRAYGVERFGTYHQGRLTINPTIAGHQDNVQELVDTLLHELVHALLDLPRGPGFPLAPDVLDASHDPALEGIESVRGRRGHPAHVQRYLDCEYGPSASNPAEDWTDINAGAQRLIIKVIRANLDRTGLGRETLVFENERQRQAVASSPR